MANTKKSAQTDRCPIEMVARANSQEESCIRSSLPVINSKTCLVHTRRHGRNDLKYSTNHHGRSNHSPAKDVFGKREPPEIQPASRRYPRKLPKALIGQDFLMSWLSHASDRSEHFPEIIDYQNKRSKTRSSDQTYSTANE
ncbi:hypothetical protein LOTGIDRAFT_165689 [Lottia gigantea]|uniref:Uncharacterized protein n=1 Tax=Lottia gigantea TaxID=225164 RepID=V4BHK4_LOTGI|nr:hypothetical protein LOTGIDRAFT_165689 [Lottia gigantea]ESO88254.1 hypothetical protein LOTGIDRAFT_165689 [Lottia gigantea]